MACSFVPRPFPPPALADVPLEYIIDQLHRLAPHYWTKPETADCTIIVPHDISKPRPHNSTFPLHPLPPGVKTSMHDPSGMGRRVTEPTLRALPRTTMKLHMDYLSAQSSLLRGLFSGASALDLVNTAIKSSSETSSLGQWINPPNRIPHSLPSSPTHPIIFLPVPDPSSFQLLVHWMYFGSTASIEEALNSGAITWEGLARNVEYLDIRDEIRVFLGKWYGKWRMAGLARAAMDSADDDDESEESESEDDSLFSPVGSTIVDTETDADVEDETDSDEEEAKRRKLRGRARSSRMQKYPSSPNARVSHFVTANHPPRPTSR